MRTYTRGYTGQRNIAYRSFTFSGKEVKEATEKFLFLTNNDIDKWNLTPSDYNQFLKGKAFVLTDCLMTTYFPSSSTKEEIEILLDYCSAVIKFTIKWFQLFPTIYSNVRYYLYLHNKN